MGKKCHTKAANTCCLRSVAKVSKISESEENSKRKRNRRIVYLVLKMHDPTVRVYMIIWIWHSQPMDGK